MKQYGLYRANSKSQARLRIKLWHEDPLCYWCGKKTMLPGPGTTKLLSWHATVDHWFSKRHPVRAGNAHHRVLACHGCNKRRNTEEQNNPPLIDLEFV